MSECTTSAARDDEAKQVFHRTWLKVYSDDILSRLAYLALDDVTFRCFFELLSMANHDITPGEIHADVQMIAHVIRRTPAKVAKALDRLQEVGLVDCADGVVYICDPKRHYAGEGLRWSDSKEATARRKANSRSAMTSVPDTEEVSGHRDSHADVTTQKENEYENQNENVVSEEYEYYEDIPVQKEAIETYTSEATDAADHDLVEHMNDVAGDFHDFLNMDVTYIEVCDVPAA